MRARPNPSGDRLVKDYLNRVVAAARHLPKGARMTFVARTKAQVDRQVGAVGTDDPGRVMEVLAALGDPEDLVRAERLRIDSKWLTKRGHDADSVAATGPGKPRVYQPRVHRRVNSRWKPATPPLPRKPAPEPAASDGLDTAAANGAGPAPDGPAPTTPAALTTSGPTTSGPTAPAPWPGDLAAMMPPGPAPGEDRPDPGKPTPLDGIWELARGHLLESVAVVVIGLGGAIVPFPFWLAGALVAMFSALWDRRDKLLALTGPLLVDLAGSVVSALFIGGKANPVVIYTHALHVDSGLWIRLGCVLTAVYLGWRVSRGRRVRTPPWQR